MREKYDLSLDSRQVVSLLIGGIVVLGAVFVLGVLVGKKLAGTPRADRAPDLLTALDHKSDALEQARAAPPLTFQEELTKPAAPAPAVARAPALSAPATTSTGSTTHVAPTPASSVPTDAASAPAASAVASKPSLPRPAAVPPPAAVEAKPERKAEPEKKESVATRTAPAAAHPAPKVPETTSAAGAFTLQLGASLNRDDAERQVSRLREKGYAPYIVTAEVPGKGTWYRVRMGSFPTKDAATRYLQDFKRETQAEAFVASTR